LSPLRRLMTLLIAVLVAAVLAACQDDGDEVTPTSIATGPAGTTATATATPRPGAGGISDEDLAAMVPTKADLGQDYAGFQEAAALDTNEERRETADDPEDEAKDQETYGRVVGYDRQLSASPSTVQADAPLLIQIGVTLFEDDDGASGYLNDDVKDIEARVGRTDLGLLLEAVDPFTVPPLGDESLGLRSRASVPPEQGGPETLYVTYFWFRRGRVLGDVALARVDDTDISQEAQTIATLLDERIEQVLGGSATPVPASTP
jgi:hypothetical protein